MKFKFNRTIFANYIYLMLLQGANFLLPLIILPYLMHVLGINKFGLVMIAASFITFFNILVDFGFNITATREVSIIRENKKKLSDFFWTIMFIKFILVIIAFIILLILVYTFPKLRNEAMVYIFSFGIIIGQALFPSWFFQGIEKMRMITIVNVTAKLIFTLLIFLLIKDSKQYIYVPVLNSLGFIIAGLLGFFISLKYIELRKPVFKDIKKITKDSSFIFVSNFSANLYSSANTFIVGMFGGDFLAGIYSSMEKLVIALKSMYIPFYQATFPWLSRKDFHNKIAFIKKIRPYVFTVGLLLTSFIFIFANDILNLIYHKPEIVKYSDVFRILGLIALFAGLGMLNISLLFPAIKAYKERMNIMILGGFFNIVLSIVLMQFFSIYGVATSAALTELLILLSTHYVLKKKLTPEA